MLCHLLPATGGRLPEMPSHPMPSGPVTIASMSRKTPLIAGTIRIDLESIGQALWEADDSTLDLVLAGLARRSTLADSQADDAQPFRLLAGRRLSWPAPAGADLAVHTNLPQLLDDLRAEFERLAG